MMIAMIYSSGSNVFATALNERFMRGAWGRTNVGLINNEPIETWLEIDVNICDPNGNMEGIVFIDDLYTIDDYDFGRYAFKGK